MEKTLAEHAFPDFDNLSEFKAIGILLGDEWHDASWQNDSCPSYGRDIDESSHVRLWVDYLNPDLREYGDSFGIAARYAVTITTRRGDSDQGTFDSIAGVAMWARLVAACLEAHRLPDIDSACRKVQGVARVKDGLLASLYFSGNYDGLDMADHWHWIPELERLDLLLGYAKLEFRQLPEFNKAYRESGK